MTIQEFGRRLRAGETSAVEATERCLARIRDGNALLNAFILVMADQALDQAREADAELASGRDRGLLHGVPVSVKDLFDIAGTPTTAASRVREGHIATADAPAVAHLRHAGAVIVGKTNLHEFAFGTTNEDSAYGPARNPIDPSRSPGGSSGGSAASVAAGMALASLGTDTGCSIRVPAAACGIVGLKPALGEIPTEGVVPLSPTLDHVGPLTQTVADAWCMYHALAGRPAPRPLSAASSGGLRFGVLRGYFCDLLDDDVRACFDAALEKLQSGGAFIDTREIPGAPTIAETYRNISFGEAAAYHAPTLEAMPERYTPPVRERLLLARRVTAEEYVRAMANRESLHQQVNEALSGLDALLLPTLPIPAPPLGAIEMPVGVTREPVRNLMLRLTQLFNLTGHPAISIPCGTTSERMPIGLQVVGPRMHTELLLRSALVVERELSER